MRPATEPVTPDQFGPYEVYERLGVGGMAQVHRAKKRGPAGFERSVALKRMLSHLAEDRSFVESFVREAKVVSLLVHPNIAQIYDFGRIGGIYYIAMELVPGFDLRKLLRYANRANAPIPLPVILSILGEMCEALEYAHTCRDEQGRQLNIVHRDISPSNMIIAHTGHLKVIDFGIAKAESRQLHTESGQVKGKLGYMSPEAALGMSSGPVSDVFSMGVVAWELVTASPLFSARTDFETMRKIREAEVVPPSRHNPTAPHELDRLILHALERDPERRLAGAGAFRKGLDYVAQRYGIQVSARAVGEWIRQFLQPEDLAGQSGRTPPPESSTSILRASAKERLQRSHDEIALATEIWGEDAQTQNAPPNGPDFSVADMGGQVPTFSGLALPGAAEVRFSPGTAPEMMRDLQLTAPGRPGSAARGKTPSAYPNLPLPAPDRASPLPQPLHPSGPMAMPQHPSGPMAMPQHPMPMPGYAQAPTPPQPARRRGGLTIVAVIAFVAAMVGGVLIIKSLRTGKPQPLAIDTGSGSAVGTQVAVVEPQHDPNDEIKDAATAPPPATPDAAADEDIAVDQPGKPNPPHRGHHPTHTSTPKHVEHATPADAAVVETPPPPEIKPDAAVAVTVQKPDPTPEPPKPDKPARTPVVQPNLVKKVSGELPTIKGDSDGQVTVKMCIDEAGNVSSVKGIGSTPPSELTRALQGWKYQPFKNQEGKVSPACFVLSVRLVVEKSD